jgi:hypothetical protein
MDLSGARSTVADRCAQGEMAHDTWCPLHPTASFQGNPNQVAKWIPRGNLTCMCGIVHSGAMLSPSDKATIKAEIERLQNAQKECTDGGIRAKIDVWIEVEKRKLASSAQQPCPVCFKPCPIGECVIDARGRSIHKNCYRAALIEGRESL